MPQSAQFNLQGIDLYRNPLNSEGYFIKAVNVDSYPYGGVTKRPGYTTFLGTNGSAVTDIFQYLQYDSNFLFAKRGNVLYYYDVTVGTGDWAVCGNGTFTATSNIGHAVLENVLIIGDGVGSTRHTTNGTSFTNTSGAPIAGDFEQYQQRIYAAGTADTLFFSSIGSADNWSGVSPADSSSIQIPGEGLIKKISKIDNKLFLHKAAGNMFSWDGDYLIDMATNSALTSPASYAKTENFGYWLNRDGIFGFGGGQPELISNAIQPLIYNNFGSGIAGTTFTNAPAACLRYDYYLSVGDITDDITQETISNAVIKYNFQKNLFYVYSFANRPTAMTRYEDADGVEHLLFGDSTGQIYKFGGTATSDNGTPIQAKLEMVFSASQPADFKKWNEYNASFNPGSKAKIQLGFTDTFRRDSLNLVEVGDTSTGDIHFRIPQGTRSKLCNVRVYENSTGPAFTWYGHAFDYEISTAR